MIHHIKILLLCSGIFIAQLLLGKTLIVFVHPSTLLKISGEKYFPAIQNIKLPGFHKITKYFLLESCYDEVFLPFLRKYYTYYKDEAYFYMFNWTGNIYPLKYKTIASQNLFDALFKYKNDNPDHSIILIGCSHGGNVILQMADLLKQYNIQIDLVVLLGTPISKKSNKNAFKKMNDVEYVFKKIINIYSFDDYIQKIDIFFNNFKLCERIFEFREGIINYKISGIGHINLWHKILWKDPFVIQVPIIMSLLRDV